MQMVLLKFTVLRMLWLGEMVEFENGEKGMAANLEESSVGIVVLGKGTWS